jgi:hypothetical protein
MNRKSEAMRRLWQDPEWRAKQLAKRRTPEYHSRQSAAVSEGMRIARQNRKEAPPVSSPTPSAPTTLDVEIKRISAAIKRRDVELARLKNGIARALSYLPGRPDDAEELLSRLIGERP